MTRCTLFFGGAHEACCAQHDQDYAPGSGVPRRNADIYLLQCAVANDRPWRGIVMFVAVRMFGWIFYRGGKR